MGPVPLPLRFRDATSGEGAGCKAHRSKIHPGRGLAPQGGLVPIKGGPPLCRLFAFGKVQDTLRPLKNRGVAIPIALALLPPFPSFEGALARCPLFSPRPRLAMLFFFAPFFLLFRILSIVKPCCGTRPFHTVNVRGAPVGRVKCEQDLDPNPPVPGPSPKTPP